MEKVLEIRDLKVYFDLTEGTVKAVDGVSFDIRRGEILGLVGESGCGKSVTAQSILRILPKSARIVNGEIVFHRNGKTLDLTRLDPEGEEIRDIRGKDISMIFQEPMASFSPVYTVGAQMVEAILLHENISKEEARKRVVEMLKR